MNNNNPSDNVNTDIWGRKIETPVSKEEEKKEEPKKVEELNTPKILGNLGEDKTTPPVEAKPDIPALKNSSPQPNHNTFFNQADLSNQLNENNTLNNGMAAPKQPVPSQVQTPQSNVNVQANPNVSPATPTGTIPEEPALASKSIGKIKKDKQKSPLAMVILFTVLIATIFFIPEITPYFSDLLSKLNISDNSEVLDEVPTPSLPDDEEEEPLPEEPVIETYLIDPTVIAKYENIEISNVSKTMANNTYYFNYTLKNIDTQNGFDFATNRVYIDFYQDNTYLGRALINIDNLGAGGTTTMQSPIDESIYTNANSFQVVNRNVSDYPISELGTVITCEAPNRTLTYTFQDNKLVSIRDNYNYIKVDDNSYTVNFLNYQAKALRVEESGIATANALAIDTGFTYTATINYTTDVDLTGEDIYYYKKDTSKDVLNYEIESLGFTCH